MSTLKDLRIEAGLTAFELAVQSEVSLSTINRLEKGNPAVSRLKAYKVIKALSKKLERPINLDDVEGLNLA